MASNKPPELTILKLLLFLFALCIVSLAVNACTTLDEDRKVNCKIECEDCKNLKVDCDRKRESESKEVTPTT